jgi:hypothetical protein
LDVADIALLAKGLKALGLRVSESSAYLAFSGEVEGRYVSGSFENGRVTMRGSSMDAAEFAPVAKRAYAHQVVAKRAKQFGWSLKATGKNTYAVTKR